MIKYTFTSFGILIILFWLFSIPQEASAQSISGYVMNQENEPVPFVNIYVKELETGTSTDSKGRYFLTLEPGDFEIIFSSIGYVTKTINVVIGDGEITKNVWLESASLELDQIVVKAKRKDPAYEIIQQVIDRKKHFLTQVKSAKSEVYVKATEEIEKKRKTPKQEKDESIGISLEGEPIDPFEEEKKKQTEKVPELNMVEMRLTLNYEYPENYKEERSAFKAYGNQSGLFIPRFSEADFNFYRNLVDLKGIAEVPIISPVSRTAILSYKYKLEEVLNEDGILVYKIKVIPRKKGNSTCHGYLYINDGTWNINRLDLSFEKGGLKFYDAFRLKQDYKQIEDSLWIPYRQAFFYETKQGRSKIFKGNTVLHYADYQKDYEFPDKFFGNEVAITTKEAYKRDSSYWNSTRPEPLTTKQQEVVAYRDSVEAVHNSKAYQDSIQAKYNKVTIGEILYHGVGFRNNTKKSNIYISSLLSIINFEVIGGFRFGPFMSYFRRWESGRMMFTSGSLNIGVKNVDLQGRGHVWFRYDPHRLADLTFSAGRSFYSVNSFDAYLNQLKISNYILTDRVFLSHRIELFNGFYLFTGFDFSDRRSIENYETSTILNKVIDETDPLVFENYSALITELRFSYTPAQKFMTEPNRKVVLGSKYPTISITHRKGWNGPFSSDIDFDYVDLSLKQDLILGIFGNSKYTVRAGKFINTKELKFVDFKRFRQSDPYLYSDPLHSFQSLDTSLVATDLFFEVHHIHHFNGALINNVPIIKKLKLRAVAGGGFLWIKQSDYRHEELFAGVERVIKLGPRRRLRVGVFGVVAESNHTGLTTDFKISFDLIDTWKKEWSY
ncbi:DUF5686 and carboxypeptidase regulatory-like domain-containing protein [Fulvivirgaceae bacterium BMA10]|uniref:DUF5686 and carboxypeptidase regulatory-like domain-containing protein n=1 Tax=Splendidivirga corallicola TaxID=3051826 RepID=A0ABT8KU15_9BACT|nr:DUF5686 and carboxypeptidase regulatory-like domain-containing protein [Fulvivirgaceae bacterium BMA10]